ncbi:class IV adenylate cyclase [Patescibacteria group bacterium]|nr:class IV adenylate cyclase [Patescibacteria group bacterium]
MYEVEAKVHISKSDFSSLKKKLDKIAKFKGGQIKKDIYYNDPKKVFIRLREENGKHFLNIKEKESKRGMESNIEMEWGIEDRKKFEKELKKEGIMPAIRKSKKTEAYQFKDCNVELNYVAKLGYFLEIEKIVKTKTQIPKAKKDLLDIFKEFGYTQKDFEKKYYLDLLEAVR